MSLINDALRRAGEAGRRRRPTPRPHLLSPLQPVDRQDRTATGMKWVAVLLVASFTTAVGFLWQATSPKSPAVAQPTAESFSVPVPPVPEPRAAPDPSPVTPPAPVQAEKRVIRVSTNLVRRVVSGTSSEGGQLSEGTTAEPMPPPVLDPGAESFPEVKLQSIILTSGKPMAMINGQTLVAGEWVGDLQVLEIRSASVRLRWQGRERDVQLRDL